MILSHSRQFIFIKTRKVSGTSMEISLSTGCGGDDIVTPISYEDELVRQAHGGCLPQNFGDAAGETRLRDAIRTRRGPPWLKPGGRFYNHMPAAEVIAAAGHDVWRRYHTFTIERHPYEKVISTLYYHARDKRSLDFEHELEAVLAKGQYANHPMYCEGGRPIVDEVIDYERLDEGLARLSARLGFDVAAHYPRTKHGYREDRRPAREILSRAAKDCIYERCRVEFELMGYAR